MMQLGDNKSMYRDGASGGFFGLASDDPIGVNTASGRIQNGYSQGKRDAKTIIANLARDKTSGEIVETIKIITHSMGGAYGKGYVEALKNYIKKLPKELQAQIKITLVADFDPFQAGSLDADSNIFTQQYSHIGRKGRKDSDGMDSGGYIGMTPLTVLFALGLQFLISTILYFSIRKYINKNMNYLFFIFNIIIYQLSYLPFTRTTPITKFFEEEFTGFIFRSYTLSSFFSTIVIIFIFQITSYLKNKNNNYS